MIVGMDEVGRGAWAGPMVVGAVLLGGAKIKGLTDSKKLTKKQRENLDKEIRQKAVAIGLGWVSAKQIDQIGLSEALKLASRRALSHIRHNYKEIIIDGTIALIDDPRVTLLKKADLLIPSVSAASIVAKVARDNYMKHLDGVFSGYAFAGHVGYGTAVHRARIRELGVTPVHRLSFSSLSSYKPVQKVPVKVTTRQIGDTGETAAKEYLLKDGHRILHRNWRTKFCEVDIVSLKKGTIYFHEVKYRNNDNQGGGIAAITPKKQRQMAFAAEFYVQRHGLKDMNLRLTAIDVSGTPAAVLTYIELG